MAQSGAVPKAQYRGVERTRPLENPFLARGSLRSQDTGCDLRKPDATGVGICLGRYVCPLACVLVSVSVDLSATLLHDCVWLIQDKPAQRR